MKTVSALLVVALFLVGGCSKKEIPEAKRPSVDPPPQAEPEEPGIKAATPDDPGPVATGVGPLAVWQRQAKMADAQPHEAPRGQPQPIDHLVYFEPGKPQHFLHNVFSVNNHTQFGFVIPPHQGNARLRGTFRSFTKRSDPDSTSDRTADVDLMLLNEEEFNEFLHGQPQSITYELDPAHNQMVSWQVPPTYAEPQTYHLVFSNSAGGAKIKFVEANFSVSFE